MARKATVHPVNLVVLRADVPAEVGAIDLNVPDQHLARLGLAGHRLAQLVGQHEGRLVLAVEVAGELEHSGN